MTAQNLGRRIPRPTPMSFLALVWLLLIDSINRFSAGPISLGGALTILTAGVVALSLFNLWSGSYHERPDREPFLPRAASTVPVPLALFVCWVVFEAPLNPTVDGVQNVLVYFSFVGTLVLASRLSSAGTAGRLLRRLRLVGWVVAAAYLATVAVGGTEAGILYGPRPVAIVAVLLLAATVAARNSRWLPLVLVGVALVTLSRSATVAALVIYFLGLAVRGRRNGRLIRTVAMFSAALVAGWLLITRYAPLRDRFIGGDNAIQYGGISINTSGRYDLWTFTWQSAQQHLWFGAGPGSAERVVTAHFGGAITHPHNDYLRLLHDFGLIGVALFVIGYVMLMRRTWVRGRVTGEPIHWAAFLSLAAVAGMAITDNVVIYPFVMVPLGLVVGASLARGGQRAAEAAPSHPEVAHEGHLTRT